MSRISENIRKITRAWGGKTTGNGISDALSDLYNSLPFSVKTKDGQEIVKPLDYKFMPEGYPKVKTEEGQEVVTPMDYNFMPEGYPKVEKEMVEIVPEQSVTANESDNGECIGPKTDLQLPHEVILGINKIFVTFNGEKYECVKSVDEYSVSFFGAPWVNDGLDFSQYPFQASLEVYDDADGGYFRLRWNADDSETITLEVYGEQEVVTPLKPELVGCTVFYIKTNTDDEGYIYKDEYFVEQARKYDLVKVISNYVLALGTDDGFIYYNPIKTSIGEWGTVTFYDGESYKECFTREY